VDRRLEDGIDPRPGPRPKADLKVKRSRSRSVAREYEIFRGILTFGLQLVAGRVLDGGSRLADRVCHVEKKQLTAGHATQLMCVSQFTNGIPGKCDAQRDISRDRPECLGTLSLGTRYARRARMFQIPKPKHQSPNKCQMRNPNVSNSRRFPRSRARRLRSGSWTLRFWICWEFWI
jgi:hypothetical protein